MSESPPAQPAAPTAATPTPSRDTRAAASVDASGLLLLEFARPALSGAVVARRRPDGPEVRAALTATLQSAPDGSSAARLALPLDDGPGVWDLYVEEHGHVEEHGDEGLRRSRVRTQADLVGGARRHPSGLWLEPYRTVRGNLSLRVRGARPSALVTHVTVRGGEVHVAGRLSEVDGALDAGELRGVARHSGREVSQPVHLDDEHFETVLHLPELVRAAGVRHDTLDLHLHLRLPGDDERSHTLRLRRPSASGSAPPGNLPLVRIAVGGVDLDVQPYYTVNQNLSLRLGAGRPPGVVTGGRPQVRQPAPRPVRVLVELYQRRLERRIRAARAQGRPPLRKRPRVYVLIRSAYGMGGTVRTVMNTVNHLAARGYRVELISLLRPREEPFFTLHPGVRHTYLFDERSRRGAGSLVRSSDSPVRATLRRLLSGPLDQWESVLTHPREVVFGRSSLLTDLLLLRKLQRLKPGVLVLTRPVLNVVGARFAPPHVRTVGQEHMNFGAHPAEQRSWMLDAYRSLDVLTVLTEGDQADYEKALDGTGVLVRKVPNGLPELPDVVADPSAKVVVAAGRLSRQKGFDLLVRAWAQVAERRPDWELRIFGDGPEKDALQTRIQDLGLDESVRLMGRTSHMYDEMARGSVYVLSSRFEGFGMVIIEAMSVGLPVVSFDCPRGPADIITAGQDGLLVPAEDVDALAQALLQVLESDALRERMSAAARVTAGRYAMSEIGKIWERIFRELAEAGRPALPQTARDQPRRSSAGRGGANA